MWYIYKTTNLVTNEIYVGQRKIRQKLPQNDGYLGSGVLLRLSVRKYGAENFKKEILQTSIETLEEANNLEKFFISDLNSLFPNGLNLTLGGNSICGYSHSEETKKKMSASSIGKSKSPEHNLKNSQSHKGHKLTEETKKKISESLKGKKKIPLSEETKMKIADKLKNKSLSEEHKFKISQGNIGKKFSDESRQKISIALKGKPRSQTHIEAARKGRIYTKLSDETKRKISESMKRHFMTLTF